MSVSHVFSRALFLTTLLSLAALPGQAPAADGFVALPGGANVVGVLEDGETYLEFLFSGWGPKWQWLGFRGKLEEQPAAAHLTCTATVAASGAKVSFDVTVKHPSPRQLRFDIRAATDKDTAMTSLICSLELPGKSFGAGKALVTQLDGKAKEVSLPLGRKGLGDSVEDFTLIDDGGRQTRFALEPACRIVSDGAARIELVGSQFKAAEPRHVTLTVDLPAEVTFYAGPNSVPAEPGLEDWFVFDPRVDSDAPSELDLSDWIDAPAGKHGRIVRQGEKLLSAGKPIKLWGINVCFSSCAPDHELADRRAAFYRKYGLNSVRLHKYADGPGWAGIQSKDSFAEFDPEGLERMDYFVAKLKEAGIYVNLSAHFGALKAGPADTRDIPYLNEFGAFSGKKNRLTLPHSGFFYSPEFQNLQIRQTVNLLKHRNPYTGLTYAEDPAVAFLEIINEQSLLFYTSMAPLKASATLRKQVGERFSDWLKQRYGSHDGLVAAWGKSSLDCFAGQGFPRGEHLDKRNLLPLGNPWFWDPEQLEGSQVSHRQRLLDSLQFLYELQCEAYDHYVKAVRAAGYAGEILGSNWQAGRAFSHYLNLHSDYGVGLIDRHNYFGGGTGSKINCNSMLRVPGSGMLSVGMQQVSDRPFMLSEWVHVWPNEWGVEGPAIIGAYGLGLQGWDVSYLFQNRDNGQFNPELGKDRWEVATPQILGVFPAVARQVLRGDVQESTEVATRYVHVPSLFEGKLDFEDRVTQEYDVKTFDSDKVPSRALAVARCVVEFTDHERETPTFDLTAYQQGTVLTSSTGQLRWHEGASKLDGFFTMNTPGTKAVVGFAPEQRCELGQVTVTLHSPFAAVYVTAKERDQSLATSKNLLVVALARARNTGMRVFDYSRLLSRGQAPLRLEPVKATISIGKPGTPKVVLLTHAGQRTDRTLPVRNGTFELDGTRDKTCYYLVTY